MIQCQKEPYFSLWASSSIQKALLEVMLIWRVWSMTLRCIIFEVAFVAFQRAGNMLTSFDFTIRAYVKFARGGCSQLGVQLCIPRTIARCLWYLSDCVLWACDAPNMCGGWYIFCFEMVRMHHPVALLSLFGLARLLFGVSFWVLKRRF